MSLRIAALQTVATPDLARNLDAARRLVAQAAAQGAQLAALPEYFCFMGRQDTDKLAIAEPGVAPGERPGPDAPIQRMLSAAAREHGLWLVGGTLPIACGRADRVRNACCVFAPDGTLAARYDKIHLFHYDNGRERFDEARVLEAGSAPTALTLGDGGLRLGLSICYDLRFPELYRALGACDLLAVPSAFTHTTGRAHWELLVRARAVENQCYVVAPAQGGLHENGRRTWGHSMIVDPWGEVLAQREADGEGVVVAELDVQRIAEVRRQLPALSHRRL